MEQIRIQIMLFLLCLIGLLFHVAFGEIIQMERPRPKINLGHIVYEVSLPAWPVCMKLCSHMTICKSVNYIKCKKLCQVSDRAPGPKSSDLKDCSVSVYSDASSFTKNFAGSCKNHDCETDEICEEKDYIYSCLPLRSFAKCDSNWIMFNGHCYYFGENNYNYMNAQNECKKYNSNLVTILDQCENIWLTTNINGEYWIGANDLNLEGHWVWNNEDKTMVYSSWLQNEDTAFKPEPNNYQGMENCALLRKDGFWMDVHCYFRLLKYICKKQQRLRRCNILQRFMSKIPMCKAPKLQKAVTLTMV